MMKLDNKALYWHSNPKWWDIVEGDYILTSEAPKEAVESFEHYLDELRKREEREKNYGKR